MLYSALSWSGLQGNRERGRTQVLYKFQNFFCSKAPNVTSLPALSKRTNLHPVILPPLSHFQVGLRTFIFCKDLLSLNKEFFKAAIWEDSLLTAFEVRSKPPAALLSPRAESFPEVGYWEKGQDSLLPPSEIEIHLSFHLASPLLLPPPSQSNKSPPFILSLPGERGTRQAKQMASHLLPYRHYSRSP